jgi:hypothetical protein
MTVRELISKLQDLPQDLIVIHDNMSCFEEIDSVKIKPAREGSSGLIKHKGTLMTVQDRWIPEWQKNGHLPEKIEYIESVLLAGI